MKVREVNKGLNNFIAGEDILHTDTVPLTETQTDTNTDAPTYTHTVPSTTPLLDLKPDELMVRHTCYLTKIQSDYVKKMAKKLKVKESEIIREAIKLLMKG